METPANNAPKLIPIPEDALLGLLEKAGQTPAEFFKVQNARIATAKAYQKRAATAVWSILWLGLSTLFSAGSLLTGLDTEDVIATVLMSGMTITEFKVRGWFLAGNAKGARYGYWNQSLFACLFLIYGAYHCFAATISPEVAEAVGSYSDIYLRLSKITYVAIGLVGGACQYALACYYKRCR